MIGAELLDELAAGNDRPGAKWKFVHPLDRESRTEQCVHDITDAVLPDVLADLIQHGDGIIGAGGPVRPLALVIIGEAWPQRSRAKVGDVLIHRKHPCCWVRFDDVKDSSGLEEMRDDLRP